MSPLLHHDNSAPHHSLTKPHILAIPFTGQGHITPMFHLSKQLVANGCTVTFVNTEHNLECIKSTVSNESLDQLGFHLESISDGLPPDFDRAANGRELFEAIQKMGKALEELIVKLAQNHEWGPVTCILSDVDMLFTQDVASKMGIPRAAFWIQSAAAYASHAAVSKALRPPLETSPQILGTAGPVKFAELSNFLQILHTADRFLFDFFLDPFHRLGEAAWILINTFEELESSELDALGKESEVLKVGPLLPSAFFTNSLQPDDGAVGLCPPQHDCLRWLDGHAPSSVLYVCFRSVTFLSQSAIQEFALGLEASAQPFLWVVRPEWMLSESDAFAQGFRERTAGRGLLVSWAPQLQVLTHDSIGGFLTHCGWNSTLESISAGVPMIAWPGFGDQLLNCRYIVDVWKVGVRLEADKDGLMSRREVEVRVRSLMVGEEGEEARRRAKDVRKGARRAMEEGGSSRQGLERFMMWLKEQASIKAHISG